MMIWLFPLLVTLHNIEEVLFLDKAGDISRYQLLLNKRATFKTLVIGLTILAYIVTTCCYLIDTEYCWYMYYGYVGAMLLNSFVPHIVSTVYFRRYTPGIVTAVLSIIPYLLILYSGVSGSVLSIEEIMISTGIVIIFLILVIRFGFLIGRR